MKKGGIAPALFRSACVDEATPGADRRFGDLQILAPDGADPAPRGFLMRAVSFFHVSLLLMLFG